MNDGNYIFLEQLISQLETKFDILQQSEGMAVAMALQSLSSDIRKTLTSVVDTLKSIESGV